MSKRGKIVWGRAAFESLRPDWDRLAESLDAPPFQRWEWIDAWFETLGRRSECGVALAEDAERGVLPLARRTIGGMHVDLLAGHGPSDYAGPLVADESAARDIAVALVEDSGAPHLLNFRALPTDSDGANWLIEGLGSGARSRVFEQCPLIDTVGTWDEYLRGRTKRHRANLKRARRRAGGDTVHVQREAASPSLFEEMVDVERCSWKWEGGLSFLRNDDQRAFLKRILLHSSLSYEIWTSRVEGTLTAFAVAFTTRRARLYYLPSFRSDVPDAGTYLLARIVEDTFREDYEEFDFLQGDEGYKRPWTTRTRTVNEIACAAGGLRARAAAGVLDLRWALARSERAQKLWSDLHRQLNRLRNSNATLE